MNEARDHLYDERELWKLWGLIVLAPIVAMAIHCHERSSWPQREALRCGAASDRMVDRFEFVNAINKTTAESCQRKEEA